MASRRPVVVALALLLLSGCGMLPPSLVARVPTAGPIEQGEQITASGADQFIRVIARGPRPGMSPTEVVRGFLDASASFDADHAIARQYLTPEASARWDPSSGVTVYEGIGAFSTQGSSVVLSGTLAGSISSIGHFAVVDQGRLRVTYALAAVDGEWRIAGLPAGLTLSRADVDRSFRSSSIYFFDPSFSTLVPDPRMLPVSGPSQATALMQALLAGPSGWLGPAVQTAVPKGVDLRVDAVPVENGIAHVDLTANALLASDRVRQAISQQIVWTLRQVADVSGVLITAAGQPFVVPGASTVQTLDQWPGVDPDALPPGARGYALQADGSLVRIRDDGSIEAAAGGAGSGQVGLREAAVSLASDFVAGVDETGQLWRGPLAPGQILEPVPVGESLAHPVFDRDGGVWAFTSDDRLVLVTPDAAASDIEVRGLGPGRVVRLAVPSRDGTRAALLVQEDSATVLLIGRIVRTSVNGKVTIEAPVRVESALANVSAVAWASAQMLAVVGSLEAGKPDILTVDMARGVVRSLGAPPDPASVAAAPGLSMLVAASGPTVYSQLAGVWQPRTAGFGPIYPN